MKRFFLLMAFILFSSLAFSQYIYSDTTWERWYGIPNYNELSTPSNHQIEHYDRGYLFHGRNEYPISPEKPIIKKTDINGYFLWERKLDSTINNAVLSMKNYHDGGLIICGISMHSNIGNPWVAKLNACMEVEWCKIFEWTGYSYTKDIAMDHDGNIVVLTYGYGEFLNERINIIKLNTDGEVLWKEDFATRDDYPNIWNAIPTKLLIGNDNHYYIAAKAEWPNNNDPGQGYGIRSLFIKVSPEGEEQWILPFGIYDALYTKPWNMWELTSGHFVAIGDNYDTQNPVIMHFDANGEELSFVTKHLMPETFFGSRLANSVMLNDTTFWGIWRNLLDMNDNYHHGYMIFDSELNILDYKEDDRWDDPANLIHTFNNKFVTVGSMKENDNTLKRDIYLSKRNEDFTYDTVYSNWAGQYDTLCEGGVVSGYLEYHCDMIVGINEVPSPNEYNELQGKVDIQVQPNPARSQAILLFENTEKFHNLQMTIYNRTGKEMKNKNLRQNIQEEVLNTSTWQNGMYFIILRSENIIVGNAKIIVE